MELAYSQQDTKGRTKSNREQGGAWRDLTGGTREK